MRNIWPEKGGLAIDRENGNTATKQDIQDLSNQIDELTDSLNVLKSDLLEYEDDMAAAVNTQAINAITGVIGTLSATSATISTISAANITASSVANLASILSQAISATNANISAIQASTINSDIIEASSVTIDSLTALSAEIGRFSVSNFSAEDITSTEMSTSNIDVSNKTTTKSLEAETANIDGLTSENVNIAKLEAEGIISEEIKTSNIVWKDSTTVVHDGIFYMVIPHFENGVYYIQGKKDDVPLFTIEIFNSVDNYFVRWSQKIIGYVTNIFKVGTNINSKLVFKINNFDGDAIQLYNAVETITENVPAPSTYETNPYTPEITYSVTYKDGQKFFKLVDLSNDGSNSGVLTMTQTEFYSLADAVSKVYDGTENILRRIYKPNQSLNKTDDVEFNSVSSPFLNVAELDVASKFKTPNIYNGVALTQTKVGELPDGSLYIPLPAETGQTGVGLALFSAKQRISTYDDIDELLKKYSIDASHLVADENWENYGPYKLTDGYSIDWNTGTAPENIISSSQAVSMIVADALNVLYLAIISGESGSYSGGYPCKVVLYPLSGIKVENNNVVLPTPINLKYATATVENNEKILYSDRTDEVYSTDDPRYSDIPWGAGNYRSKYISLGKDGGIALEGREWAAWDPNNNAFFEFTNIFGQILICSAGSFDYVKVDETDVGTSALYRKSSVGSGTPDIDVEETGYRNALTDLRLFTGLHIEWNGTEYEILFDSTSEYANIWNWNNGTLSLKEDYSKCEMLQLTYSSHTLVNFTSLEAVANTNGSITLTPDVGSPITVSSSMNGSSSILRVKAVPTTTQVLPLVPYKQRSGNNKPIGYNETEDAFEKLDDVDIAGDLSVAGDASLVDVTADNITVDDTLSADKIESNDLKINGNASINGDLYVNGTTHTVDVEEILATNDILTLRANNPLGLANNQVAGIVVNKYDGVHDLSLVTDNDGTLRVGTGTGVDTSYTKIALKHQDGLYYTYDDTDPEAIQYTLLNPQPSGTMTAWTNKTETSGYTLWASATFTVIDKTSLEPLLTRDESTNISNKQILGWDAQNSKAVGVVPIPIKSRQALVSKITNGVVSYEWSSNAGGNGVAFIGTRAQYNIAKLIPEGEEGYIPSGSLVIITDEDDYITGEDR